MYLQDRSWRISYSSNENNPIADFYIPALECTVFAIPEAVKQKLLRYTPNSKPSWKREDEIKNEETNSSEIQKLREEEDSVTPKLIKTKVPDPSQTSPFND